MTYNTNQLMPSPAQGFSPDRVFLGYRRPTPASSNTSVFFRDNQTMAVVELRLALVKNLEKPGQDVGNVLPAMAGMFRWSWN